MVIIKKMYSCLLEPSRTNLFLYNYFVTAPYAALIIQVAMLLIYSGLSTPQPTMFNKKYFGIQIAYLSFVQQGRMMHGIYIKVTYELPNYFFQSFKHKGTTSHG